MYRWCEESPRYNLVNVDLFDALESDLMLYDDIGFVYTLLEILTVELVNVLIIFLLMMLIHVLMQMIMSLTKPFPGPHATRCVMLLV